MSDNNQLKAGQLVSAPQTSINSEFDQMFDGLGLGSYVNQKSTASNLASNLGPNSAEAPSRGQKPQAQKTSLSLAEKQKLVNQQPQMASMASNQQLQPSMNYGSKSSAQG